MGKRERAEAGSLPSFSLAAKTHAQFPARRGGCEVLCVGSLWSAEGTRSVRRHLALADHPAVQRDAYRPKCRRFDLKPEPAHPAAQRARQASRQEEGHGGARRRRWFAASVLRMVAQESNRRSRGHLANCACPGRKPGHVGNCEGHGTGHARNSCH